VIKVKEVIPHPDFKLTVIFENGNVSSIDMNFIFHEFGPVVNPLKSYEQFRLVYLEDGIITWPTGYDIDPHHLQELAS
jgi:hypothetical protein